MQRAAVVITAGNQVALIRREAGRNEPPYYLFPGGGVEFGETPLEAACREASEELGVIVQVERLLAISEYRGNTQFYYSAAIVAGAFGTGTGAEMGNDEMHPRGTYTPIWLDRAELTRHDVRPRSLAVLLNSQDCQQAEAVWRLSD